MYEADRGLLWGEIFQFPTPPDKSAPHESALWRKYLPSDDDVHAAGIEWEANQTPPFRYVGFVTATAGDVRRTKSSRGHGFAVEHDTTDAPIYHVKVSLTHAGGGQEFSKGEKVDLRAVLANAFGRLVPYVR